MEEAGIKGKCREHLLSYVDYIRKTRTEIYLITEHEELPYKKQISYLMGEGVSFL